MKKPVKISFVTSLLTSYIKLLIDVLFKSLWFRFSSSLTITSEFELFCNVLVVFLSYFKAINLHTLCKISMLNFEMQWEFFFGKASPFNLWHKFVNNILPILGTHYGKIWAALGQLLHFLSRNLFSSKLGS